MRDTRRGAWKILTLLAILSLVFAACGGNDGGDGGNETGQQTDTEDKKTGGTVVFAAEQEPESLNWLTAAHNTAWGQYIMQWVWPGTYNARPNGEMYINEDLIESRELTSEDPQTVVYKINPDATWSDGKPITADDFIYYWEAQNGKNEAYLPAVTSGYEDIESVVGSDNGKTVTVKFAKKYADWETLFDYILPVHYFEKVGGGDKVKGFNEAFVTQTFTDLANFVSGGPFTVTELKPGQSLTLSRNDKYWGEKPFLDRIVFPFITDASQQPAALENREADGGFPQAQIDLVKQLQGLQGIVSDVGFGTFWEHIDFNFENQHLGVKEVRLAIAKAIDRPQIVERLPKQVSEDAEVLNNRIYKPNQEAYEDHGKGYEKADPAGAARLLEQAGYTKGADGIYAKGGNKLSIRITWREPNPRRQQTAQLLQNHLKAAGIDATLAPQPDFTFLDEGNFDIALFGWTGGIGLASNEPIYTSDGGQNHAGHKNAEIDRLFEQANVELDAERRAELMNQIDEILWQDMPTLPLFQVPEVLAYRETIDGPEYNGFIGPTWNANIWSLK